MILNMFSVSIVHHGHAVATNTTESDIGTRGDNQINIVHLNSELRIIGTKG